jgi:hypothetical protein
MHSRELVPSLNLVNTIASVVKIKNMPATLSSTFSADHVVGNLICLPFGWLAPTFDVIVSPILSCYVLQSLLHFGAMLKEGRKEGETGLQ